MHEVMGGKDVPSMSGLDGAGEGPRNGSSDLQACVTLLQLVGIPVCHAKARRPLLTSARSITYVRSMSTGEATTAHAELRV